jgi:hypothetical protein
LLQYVDTHLSAPGNEIASEQALDTAKSGILVESQKRSGEQSTPWDARNHFQVRWQLPSQEVMRQIAAAPIIHGEIPLAPS